MDNNELMGYVAKIMMPSRFRGYFFDRDPKEKIQMPLEDAENFLEYNSRLGMVSSIEDPDTFRDFLRGNRIFYGTEADSLVNLENSKLVFIAKAIQMERMTNQPEGNA